MIRSLTRGTIDVWMIVSVVCILLGVIVFLVAMSAGHQDDAILECIKTGSTPAECKAAFGP